jgi:hypothetical protein
MNHDHDNIFYDLIQNMTSDTREPTKTNGSHKHVLFHIRKYHLQDQILFMKD